MVKDLREISVLYQNFYKQTFRYTINVSPNEIDNRRDEYDSIVGVLKEIFKCIRW